MNTKRLQERMTSEQYGKCHAIIHGASTLAAGVGTGLAQIPLSDNAVITPIQVAMVTALGTVFGLEITGVMGRAAVASAIAGTVGRMISQVLVGWVPGVGNVVNASTAAALTEAIGWAVTANFAKEAEEAC